MQRLKQLILKITLEQLLAILLQRHRIANIADDPASYLGRFKTPAGARLSSRKLESEPLLGWGRGRIETRPGLGLR